MKVVVNHCFGGFELSGKAVKWLIEGRKSETVKISDDWSDERDDRFSVDLGDGWKGHSFCSGVLCKGDDVYLFDESETSRSHPDLIAVVEALGEDANGPHAKLAIVEIPDNVDYEISDYDGVESIHEKHRSW